MKRYRVLGEDFDTRANVLELEIEESWDDYIREMWRKNKEGIKRGLLLQYGFEDADQKLKNFVDLGPSRSPCSPTTTGSPIRPGTPSSSGRTIQR